MKKWLGIVAIFICGLAHSQSGIYVPVNPSTYGSNNLRIKATQALNLPSKPTLQINTTDTTPQIFYQWADSSIWAWSRDKGFFKVGSGNGGGSISIPSANGGTVAQLRSMTTTTGNVYISTDKGGGDWVDEGLDDGTTTDDGVFILHTANGHRLRRQYNGEIYFEWFGAKGDSITDNTSAVNAAIDYANSLNPTIVDASGVKGVVLKFGIGRFSLPSTLHAAKRSGILIKGSGPNATTLIQTQTGVGFGWGGTNGYAVGGGMTDLTLERPVAAGFSTAIEVSNAHRLTFSNISLVNMGTFLNLGTSATRFASGITISNVTGYVMNDAENFINVNWGAGFYVDNLSVFVGAVLPPIVNRTDTLAVKRGTNGIVFGAGWWDTFQMSNSYLHFFDNGILANPTTDIVQSLFISNTVIDYCRTSAVYLQGLGSGYVSGVNMSNNWYASWEGDAVHMANVLSANFIGGRIISAGASGVFVGVNTDDITVSNMTIEGTNRLVGTYFGVLLLDGNRHTVTNNKISREVTGGSFPWQNFAGLGIGSNANNVVATGNTWYGTYAGLYNEPSNNIKVIRNNIPDTDSLVTINQLNLTNANKYFDDAGSAKTGLAFRNTDNVLSGLADPYTGKSITYSKVTTQPEGFPINDGWIDSVMYRKKGSEYFLRNIDHEVNIKWFNAKGDAVYMEQDAGANFGRVTQRDHTTLATDNTVAFQKAIDFIHNYSLPTFAQIGGASVGYRTKKLKLVIPAGSYLITSPEVFTKLRSAVTAYADAGFTIEGDGQNATEIIYRNDGDTSKFLIENGNAWNGIVFKDLTFKCVTGNEKIYHETSTGTAGFTTFENVGFENYKVAAEIGGSLNADRGTFRNVTAVSAIPGNTFFKINNPQAIGFVFEHVSIRETDGTVFDVYATGSNTLTGASSIELFGNSCLYKVHPADLGEQENPVFSSYSTKIELHGTSILADVTGAYINIYSSNHNTNYSTAPYSVILRNNLAGIKFFESEFRDFKTAIIQNQVSGSGRNKAGLEFHSSRFRGANWQATNISYFASDFTTPTVDTIANVVFDNPIFYDEILANAYKVISNKQIQLQGLETVASNAFGVNVDKPTSLVHAQRNFNSAATIKVENLAAGDAAQADFRAINNSGDFLANGVYSSTTNPYKVFQPSGAINYSSGIGGIGILAETGTVRIAGNGASSGLTIDATSVTAANNLFVNGFGVASQGLYTTSILDLATNTTGAFFTPTEFSMIVNNVKRGSLTSTGLVVTGTVSASKATLPTELLRKDQLDSAYVASGFAVRNAGGIGDTLMNASKETNTLIYKRLAIFSNNATKTVDDTTIIYQLNDPISGTATIVGDGSLTSFTIPLSIVGLSVDSRVWVTPRTALGTGVAVSWVDVSDESMTVYFTSAPSSGTKTINYMIQTIVTSP